MIDPNTSRKPGEKQGIGQTGGAQSGAPAAFSTVQDPDLRRLIDAWPTLPAAVKAGILAMVASVGGG